MIPTGSSEVWAVCGPVGIFVEGASIGNFGAIQHLHSIRCRHCFGASPRPSSICAVSMDGEICYIFFSAHRLHKHKICMYYMASLKWAQLKSGHRLIEIWLVQQRLDEFQSIYGCFFFQKNISNDLACWKNFLRTVLQPIGCSSDQCILTAQESPLLEYNNTAGRIRPSTSCVRMGESVQFFWIARWLITKKIDPCMARFSLCTFLY